MSVLELEQTIFSLAQIPANKHLLQLHRSCSTTLQFWTLLTRPLHDQEPKPQSGTSMVLQISNQDFEDICVLCIFKFNIES